MYLESLAECRRRLGLPALTVGWGPIGDVGFLARNERVREALVARIGGQLLSSAQALNQLEELLKADRTGVAVVDLDWRRLQKTMPGTQSPRFRALGGRAGEEVGDGAVDADIRALIANQSNDEVLQTVTELLFRANGQCVAHAGPENRQQRDDLRSGNGFADGGRASDGDREPVRHQRSLHSRDGGATVAEIASRIVTQLRGSEEGAAPAERDDQREALSSLVSSPW